MGNRIELRTVEKNGKSIKVTADETGTVWLGGNKKHRPVTAQGITFVWGGEEEGLPPYSRVALQPHHIDAIERHSREWREAMKAKAAKERAFDEMHNEGGEGYNPYRD